jgi:uncharacterized membrane protein YsdA (DUF1294 family)
MAAVAQQARKPATRKPRADATKPAARRSRKAAPKPLPRFAKAWRLAAALGIVALALVGWRLHRLPIDVPLAYLVMGLVSFALYGLDKRRAEAGAWRVPEATLHTLDLLGGIGGGALGQLAFRHKTSKLGFVLVSASFAALHVAALLLVLSPLGAAVLSSS